LDTARHLISPMMLDTLFRVFVLIFVTAATTKAVSVTQTYKPGEYVVIEQGLSPDKRHSIAAHGDGPLGDDNFHLYLMDAATRKPIGPLTEIEATMDTRADAFHGEWAPDSRHVAISYRFQLHDRFLDFYRIEDRRAFAVKYPDLFSTVAPHFNWAPYGFSGPIGGALGVKWKSPTQFILMETGFWRRGQRSPKAKFGKFLKEEIESDENGKPSLSVYFSAEARCELTAEDHCKIVALNPGKFGP